MHEAPPSAVTLKISKTSVMLYACHYAKLPEGNASLQTYLGSFPVNATEVPAQFERLLREATRLRPERYTALMQRITDRVLIPARSRKAEAQSAARRAAVEAALHYALDAVSGIQPQEIDAALAKAVDALLAQVLRLQPGPRAADSEDELPVF